MGYARALLQRDVRKEEADLQRKSKKKSLWGSIGRTVGGFGAMALTGGAVNPLTLGLLTGGASFLGGAVGAKAAGGKLTGGKFFKEDRKSLQKELGAFGSKNIVESLKSGLTSGFGQAAKLQKAKLLGKGTGKAAKLSEGFGMDFKGSTIGKMMAPPVPAVQPPISMIPPEGTPVYGDIKEARHTATGVFDVDLEDVEETVSASEILSRKKTAMSQFFEDPKNVKELGLYTGMGPEGYRSTNWRPGAGTDLREFSDKYKTSFNTEIAGIPEWRSDARDWASEIGELKSQEFQQSLRSSGITERLGLPGSSKSWRPEIFRR